MNLEGRIKILGRRVVRDTRMLKPLDRHRRDSTLFQFTTRRLRDFADPDYLLIRIDEQFDFAMLVAPLEDHYCPDNGPPPSTPK